MYLSIHILKDFKKIMLNFENCDKMRFPGVPPYGIPEIAPEHIDVRHLEWIPFNYAKTAKDRQGKGVHFYVDDYQFVRVWNHPEDYIQMLSQFGAVCTPDFSQYTDMPVAMRLYNHYRKHWLGAYWQAHGIRVIPTICWSTPDTYDWCFDGEPYGSLVSISSVGTQARTETREAFARGCREAVKRLNPSEILWYGKCPEEFDWNVIRVKPFYEQVKERSKDGR